ncbi:penicillin acylase family protein [Blastococcus sp. VKM Ac-2987]|uniref:penicillin acylase family protein n=1 Tax=Blastococcus sp. VKM Ac-2987 TaxID=3004141 RepID=UPI0022AB9BFC|nr:penicillin acylase family protein [Blastococcus sp. VKM Ac-2987]MCZ2860307.1 penicillin acylase family protein [Blastococcus sp. VKM Ac-2987]
MPDSAEYAVPGLGDRVEILVDEWGVPHLYAGSRDDVFLAQGFNAARDRLFQIDLWRRRGLGQLAEVFGEEHLERDRAARLFLYRGDMRAEWLSYGSDTKRVVSAFVAGINAFVRLTREDPSHLPPEFVELGYLPALWEPADVARIRSHGLFYNLEQEVARARTLRDFGPEVEDLRRVREPGAPLVVPDGLDLSLIPDDVLRVYRLATTPPVLSQVADPGPRYDPEGSNNWVLAASWTATGRPILANDPHRTVTLPSLRYLAHLSAPGLDVIGGGEPALPGISIGHNGRIAFGLTIFAIDQEDLYVYRTNPDDPRQYWYDGGWSRMRVVHETVRTGPDEERTVELVFTRHGPVVLEDPDRHSAFAVRAAWLQPGMAPYLGSMDYMGAPDPDAFVTAMNRWGAPGENQVYAAPDGTIGWQPAGLVPVRPNWDGTLPVPGDGRYEWDGFYDGDQLPSVQDPPEGWFATANEMNLPDDYPNDERTVTYDWYAGVRHERIAEELGSRGNWSVQDCVDLQTDYVSVPARRIVAVLERLLPSAADEAAQRGLDLLLGWDGDEAPDSAAAALFEIWYRRHLRPGLLGAALARLLPEDRRAEALARISPVEDTSADSRVDLGLLLRPGDRLGPDPDRVLAGVLERSLASAWAEVRQLLGEDPAGWQWGTVHRARLRHPQADLLGPEHASWTALETVPRGGSGDTVGCCTYSRDFTQTVGASFRLVVDVGGWDSSVAMNSPGQSGVPTSRHYQDLLGRWAADGAFPLLYTRERVMEHLAQRIVLVPTAGPAPTA